VEDGGGSAALVFTRSGGHWTPDKKLVGTSAVGKSAPSVALSADGSVVMLGGSNDNGGIGAVWVFAQSGGGWSQDKKLIGTGAMGRSTTLCRGPPTAVDEATSRGSAQATALPIMPALLHSPRQAIVRMKVAPIATFTTPECTSNGRTR
jgi:hypothetical protein